MGIMDNLGYVKQTMAGFPDLLMAQSAASAKSKFLSFNCPVFLILTYNYPVQWINTGIPSG